MAATTKPAANGFVAAARRLYNLAGFSHGYNFALWLFFAGVWAVFILARLQYLDFYGVYCNPNAKPGNGALPGECWYYLRLPRYKFGIMIHLATILPAGLLSCLQFIPLIRRKAMVVHRVIGRISVALSVVGTASAMMIARNSFGGGFEAQTGLGLTAILFLGSLLLAMVSIKRGRIEQHKAWMLRAWFYGGSILTMRLIMVIAAVIISKKGGYYAAMPCGKIEFIIKEQNIVAKRYPSCAAYFSGANPDQHAVVLANISGQDEAQAAAVLNMVAGGALWLALALHAAGIEIYLNLTSAEHKRLRNVSYKPQVAVSDKHAEPVGATVDRVPKDDKRLDNDDGRKED